MKQRQHITKLTQTWLSSKIDGFNPSLCEGIIVAGKRDYNQEEEEGYRKFSDIELV